MILPVPEQSSTDVEELASALNVANQSIGRDLRFEVDMESGRSVIQVLDRETGEVIRQIPPEKADLYSAGNGALQLSVAGCACLAASIVDARDLARFLLSKLIWQASFSSGIGSGLDIAGIVQSLVAAEGQPVDARISQQEARAQAKLSAFGSLKSALADFRDKLDIMQTLDKFSEPQSDLRQRRLFHRQRRHQRAAGKLLARSRAARTGAETHVGRIHRFGYRGRHGHADAAVGAATADIEITTENNTLAGIRDAINSATDNPGVAATIVNADSGSYLILTGESTGAANDITVTQTGGDGGLSALEYDPGWG